MLRWMMSAIEQQQSELVASRELQTQMVGNVSRVQAQIEESHRRLEDGTGRMDKHDAKLDVIVREVQEIRHDMVVPKIIAGAVVMGVASLLGLLGLAVWQTIFKQATG